MGHSLTVTALYPGTVTEPRASASGLSSHWVGRRPMGHSLTVTALYPRTATEPRASASGSSRVVQLAVKPAIPKINAQSDRQPPDQPQPIIDPQTQHQQQ